jgi:hypothetical protein
MRKGIEVGVPVPVTASIVDTVRQIDAGKLKPARENIELVLKNAGY